jgi:hypothetical protein
MDLPEFITSDPNWDNRPWLLPETINVRAGDGTIHATMNRQVLARLLQAGGEIVSAPEPEPIPVEVAVQARDAETGRFSPKVEEAAAEEVVTQAEID